MNKKLKITLVLVIAVLLMVIVLLVAVLPKYFFENYYLDVMKNLNTSETKEAVRANVTYAYNFTELFA